MKKLLFLFSTLLFIGCNVEVTTIYTLNVSSNPTEGGIINPSSGEYEEGAEVTINVSPNPNYEFDKWSGDWGGSEYPLTLIMDGDKTLVGNFNFLDSDGDGVGDDDDLDNNTRSGVPVDENGVMLNPIYSDEENGVTIKCKEWAVIGDTGIVNDATYTLVDLETLKEMIQDGGDVSKVCTSKIDNLSELFYQNNSFNQDISSWDVENVTDMNYMFYQAKSFNQNLSFWNVKNVSNMGAMFSGAESFNQNISSWNVDNVTRCFAFCFGTEQWTSPKPSFKNDCDEINAGGTKVNNRGLCNYFD